MNIVKILVLILLILSVIRLGFWGWSFITKRKYKVPLIARIIRTENDAVVYRIRHGNRTDKLSFPYISYYFQDKTYTSNRTNIMEIIKGEQKKQNKTDYIRIYIDKNNPECFSYSPPHDYAISLLYNVGWMMIVLILFTVL